MENAPLNIAYLKVSYQESKRERAVVAVCNARPRLFVLYSDRKGEMLCTIKGYRVGYLYVFTCTYNIQYIDTHRGRVGERELSIDIERDRREVGGKNASECLFC